MGHRPPRLDCGNSARLVGERKMRQTCVAKCTFETHPATEQADQSTPLCETGTGADHDDNPNKALWEKGDFTQIARSMRKSGEALVAGLGVTQGLRILDLGCGDGTTALPAAMLGADVLGVDIARNLVEAGNRRAREAGLTHCRFQEGDASNLQDLEDNSFDLVVSIFGAMFAPRPAMSRRRWCASLDEGVGLLWETGFLTTRRWSRRS